MAFIFPILYIPMKYVPWKDYKPVAADLKQIYQAVTEEKARQALDDFAEKWDSKYPQISRSWRSHWQNLNTLFNYPADIRKAIYTTNAIESLNSVIRKVIKKCKLFPSDESANKVVAVTQLDLHSRFNVFSWGSLPRYCRQECSKNF